MFKSESTIGMVGSVLAAIFAGFFSLVTIFAAFFIDKFLDFIRNLDIWQFDIMEHHYRIDDPSGIVSGIIIAAAFFLLIVAVASVILGFMGTAKLSRGDRNGSTLLIIAGGLAFVSAFEFIPFVLFLIAGILSATKKEPQV